LDQGSELPLDPEPPRLEDAPGTVPPSGATGPATPSGGGAGRGVPSSAIVTAPNAITLLRLVLMPVCAWLLATQHYGSGLVLTALVGATDWVDGWLARRIGQVSRLGQLLDPFADRLLIASVAVALLVRQVLPWQAAALLLGRDLVLLAGWPLLRRRGVQPPEVVWIGKAATFDLLCALPLLVWARPGWSWPVPRTTSACCCCGSGFSSITSLARSTSEWLWMGSPGAPTPDRSSHWARTPGLH